MCPTTSRISAVEWAELRRLRLLALEESPDAFLGDFATESALKPSAWKRRCNNEEWFAAELDGRNVGLGMLAKRHGPDKYLHIESMWVEPDHRTAGVGRALLERLESEAKRQGEEKIALWVFVGNTDAWQYYVKMGYEFVRDQDIKISVDRVTTEKEFQKGLR
ncbi:GNAT family N-acetyltransferase [Streptomyces sp. SID13031]|uniref:GNAT family N-acetyltransferase n=1 Tax=Streptomyces sp. SID13031 TaxID=2706046 RepID=UPI0013C6A4EF|nr:GNAT family N-acetyltransferase [Streptomyces sp. SID13031]NEA35511.1 GNAT family N-acetyltransferase [Streptomyces sp. SID13031]